MKLFKLLFILLIALYIPTVFGATLTGDIYDFSLNKVKQAKVEINTTPVQRVISEQSHYSLQVSPGTYSIKAEQLLQGEVIASTSELVLIPEEGNYTLDFILFPVIEDVEFEEIPVDETPDIPNTSQGDLILMVFFVIFIIVIGSGYFFYRKLPQEKTEEFFSDDLEEVLSFIKKQGGRTTQKDIRRNFPQSEAKMSLILTELEEKGKVKKIKKGRGNIIILN